ncbi:MAG: GNAT family N-acetyltransferase [Ilumatobacter sp.]|jgi:GNAT superfamily N-acetyltransferase|uniref:GNAT family N-acetyltransferase n=1 Tax=Ilumatobacter sp. TaxID=1967498 RepID=UPI0039187A83
MLVRRATPSDLGRLCVTAMRSFHDDPIMRWLWPNDDEFFAPGGEVFREAMAGWLRLGDVWCTDDAAAVAVWIPPGRPPIPPDPDPDVVPHFPEDLLERFTIIAPLMEAHTPTDDHWYLQLLGTHPDWQRQGLGAALMQSMFERADAEGLPCYLETETLVNVGYYRRHGFDVISEWDVPAGEHVHRFSSFGDDPTTEIGPHMWGMLRPPR